MNFHLKDARSGGALQVRERRLRRRRRRGLHGVGQRRPAPGRGRVREPERRVRPFGRDEPQRAADGTPSAARRRREHARAGTRPRSGARRRSRTIVKLWGNFGYFLGSSTKVYAHTNYANQQVTGGFFFRNPNTRSGVFSLDARRDPAHRRPARRAGRHPRRLRRLSGGPGDGRAARSGGARWHVLWRIPNCFTFQERFPGGFTPQFGADVTDVVSGGEASKDRPAGCTGTSAAITAANEVDFFIFNTVNASLGPDDARPSSIRGSTSRWTSTCTSTPPTPSAT